jgi:hypothetical protein
MRKRAFFLFHESIEEKESWSCTASSLMSLAIPDSQPPPIFIPTEFVYSIRATPACVVFDYPDHHYEGGNGPAPRESRRENKKTKRTRTFYRWVTQNKITEAGHDLILPWGLSVEEFALIQLHEAYEKRDFVKKKTKDRSH